MKMHIESVVVTGANRGIGLEFVRQLVNLPKPPRFVFATYRNRDTVNELKSIRDAAKDTEIILIKMDVTKSSEVETAGKIVEDMVGERGLTLLINNAGAVKFQFFPEITEEDLLFHYSTNTVGPILVLKEMLPLLQKAAKREEGSSGMNVSRAAVLNISSSVGSITKSGTEFTEYLGAMGYRMSKAALNMAMRLVSVSVKDKGVLVVQMCPGWVKTDMGTELAEIEIPDSISAMLKTLDQLDESHHGAFIDRNGNPISF